MHRFSAFWHMRLPHRLQGQKLKSQSHGAGAYCGGHLAAQLVIIIIIIIINCMAPGSGRLRSACSDDNIEI